MVWDADGTYRLDGKTTQDYWDRYGNRVAAHFRFDEKQQKAAEKTVKGYKDSLNWYLNSKREEIREYVRQLERRDRNRADTARADLESLQAHDARIDSDRNQLKGPMLATIDKMWKDLENDLNALATEKQYQAHGRLPIGKIGRRFGDSEFADAVVPYFDTVIGLLLILGLFTRVAAIAGALFLASVCASQWPGYGGAPIYYQFVEMLALFALAAIGAGQFCGLDYVITGVRRLYRPAGTQPVRTTVARANVGSTTGPKGAKA